MLREDLADLGRHLRGEADGVKYLVDDVLLFSADPIEGTRGDPVQRVDVPPNGLVQSYEHQIRVVQP